MEPHALTVLFHKPGVYLAPLSSQVVSLPSLYRRASALCLCARAISLTLRHRQHQLSASAFSLQYVRGFNTATKAAQKR